MMIFFLLFLPTTLSLISLSFLMLFKNSSQNSSLHIPQKELILTECFCWVANSLSLVNQWLQLMHEHSNVNVSWHFCLHVLMRKMKDSSKDIYWNFIWLSKAWGTSLLNLSFLILEEFPSVFLCFSQYHVMITFKTHL